MVTPPKNQSKNPEWVVFDRNSVIEAAKKSKDNLTQQLPPPTGIAAFFSTLGDLITLSAKGRTEKARDQENYRREQAALNALGNIDELSTIPYIEFCARVENASTAAANSSSAFAKLLSEVAQDSKTKYAVRVSRFRHDKLEQLDPLEEAEEQERNKLVTESKDYVRDASKLIDVSEGNSIVQIQQAYEAARYSIGGRLRAFFSPAITKQRDDAMKALWKEYVDLRTILSSSESRAFINESDIYRGYLRLYNKLNDFMRSLDPSSTIYQSCAVLKEQAEQQYDAMVTEHLELQAANAAKKAGLENYKTLSQVHDKLQRTMIEGHKTQEYLQKSLGELEVKQTEAKRVADLGSELKNRQVEIRTLETTIETLDQDIERLQDQFNEVVSQDSTLGTEVNKSWEKFFMEQESNRSQVEQSPVLQQHEQHNVADVRESSHQVKEMTSQHLKLSGKQISAMHVGDLQHMNDELGMANDKLKTQVDNLVKENNVLEKQLNKATSDHSKLIASDEYKQGIEYQNLESKKDVLTTEHAQKKALVEQYQWKLTEASTKLAEKDEDFARSYAEKLAIEAMQKSGETEPLDDTQRKLAEAEVKQKQRTATEELALKQAEKDAKSSVSRSFKLGVRQVTDVFKNIVDPNAAARERVKQMEQQAQKHTKEKSNLEQLQEKAGLKKAKTTDYTHPISKSGEAKQSTFADQQASTSTDASPKKDFHR